MESKVLSLKYRKQKTEIEIRTKAGMKQNQILWEGGRGGGRDESL